MGPTALRPIRRAKQWLSVLLKDTSVMAGDSNPHSADQKHQSLNLMLLTARPWHFRQRFTHMSYEQWISACTNPHVALKSVIQWRSWLFNNVTPDHWTIYFIHQTNSEIACAAKYVVINKSQEPSLPSQVPTYPCAIYGNCMINLKGSTSLKPGSYFLQMRTNFVVTNSQWITRNSWTVFNLFETFAN